MEISVPIPLDSDGFIRRECPKCTREFKWHHGATGDRPADYNDPPVYFCPLCGETSDPSDFITQDQAEFARGYAMLPAMQELEAEMNRTGFDFKIDSVEPPDPLTEPDDMSIIAPPCHDWEPVKVPDDSKAPFYCLLCGEAFAV